MHRANRIFHVVRIDYRMHRANRIFHVVRIDYRMHRANRIFHAMRIVCACTARANDPQLILLLEQVNQSCQIGQDIIGLEGGML
jgi:hypothetical protein